MARKARGRKEPVELREASRYSAGTTRTEVSESLRGRDGGQSVYILVSDSGMAGGGMHVRED